jgi:hypothetical protein
MMNVARLGTWSSLGLPAAFFSVRLDSIVVIEESRKE